MQDTLLALSHKVANSLNISQATSSSPVTSETESLAELFVQANILEQELNEQWKRVPLTQAQLVKINNLKHHILLTHPNLTSAQLDSVLIKEFGILSQLTFKDEPEVERILIAHMNGVHQHQRDVSSNLVELWGYLLFKYDKSILDRYCSGLDQFYQALPEQLPAILKSFILFLWLIKQGFNLSGQLDKEHCSLVFESNQPLCDFNREFTILAFMTFNYGLQQQEGIHSYSLSGVRIFKEYINQPVNSNNFISIMLDKLIPLSLSDDLELLEANVTELYNCYVNELSNATDRLEQYGVKYNFINKLLYLKLNINQFQLCRALQREEFPFDFSAKQYMDKFNITNLEQAQADLNYLESSGFLTSYKKFFINKFYKYQE